MSRRAALLATLLAGFALPACGSDSEPRSDPPRRVESSDRLPPLPAGWRPFANRFGGYAFGLPPGWEAKRRGTATDVSSFDGLAKLSISADRTGDAVELPIEDFAVRVLAARPGYEEPIEPGEPREFEHPYAGAVVEAEGVAIAEGTGVAQRVEVIVLRRPQLVNLTIVIAANAIPEGLRSAWIAERLVETMRSRPVGPSL